MEFRELVRARRSVRKFEDREVESEVLDRLIEATMTAPSSRNSRSTKLLVVQDREKINSLASMRDYGTSFISSAPLVIIVAGDRTLSDTWEINASISATILQLACANEGLGSCWGHIVGRPHKQNEPDGVTAAQYVRGVVSIPSEYELLCAVAIGYPAKLPGELPEFDAKDSVIFVE